MDNDQAMDINPAQPSSATTLHPDPPTLANLTISPFPAHTLDQALTTYRHRMRTSNKLFMHRVADAINTTYPNKRDRWKVHFIARFYTHSRGGWWRSDNPYVNDTERDVQTLDAVLALPKVEDEGVVSPALSPELARYAATKAILLTFEQEALAEHGAERLASEELGIFLQLVGGVKDVDFRLEGVCGFLDEDYALGECKDEAAIDAFMEEHSWHQDDDENYDPVTKAREELLDDFEILGGFEASQADLERLNWQAHWSDFCFYLYCRPRPEGERQSMQHLDVPDEWRWRVVMHQTVYKSCELTTRVFETIVDFLEWYGGWYERPGTDELLVQWVGDNYFEDIEQIMADAKELTEGELVDRDRRFRLRWGIPNDE